MDHEEQEDTAAPNSSASLETPKEEKVTTKAKKRAPVKENPYAGKPWLRMNSKGAVVELYQKVLADLAGIELEANGYFGHRTHRATAEFQRTFGLEVTGAVNDKTWDMLAYLEDAETSKTDPTE